MDVRFRAEELERRYQDHKAARRAWGEKIAVRYVQRVNALYAAKGAEDLFALRFLALHPLKDRKGQHALRLDDTWRLVVRFDGRTLTLVTVEEVSKHHGADAFVSDFAGLCCDSGGDGGDMVASKRLSAGIAVPPGSTLAEEIEARGISQSELARRMGRPVQAVNEIIRGKKAITAETALGLEDILGVSADFWLRLEADFQLAQARFARAGSARQARRSRVASHP